MNNPNESEVYNILRETAENGVGWAHGNGFKWLKDILIPYIEIARNSFVDEELLIADCFYVLGDIYDFNHTPLAAIKAYSEAIRYYSEFSSAYREMAGMYQNIGDYEKASQLIDIAINLDLEDEYAISDRKIINEDVARNAEPYFKKSDVIWQCDELLAEYEFDKALSLLNNYENLECCKSKARCCGALFDYHNYIKEWKKILEMNLEFEFSYSDWFYMPEEVFDSSEIWHILLGVYKNIKPGVFLSSATLFQSERYRKLEDKERYKLYIELNIYRTEKNLKELNLLYELYPEWSEVREIIDDIK